MIRGIDRSAWYQFCITHNILLNIPTMSTIKIKTLPRQRLLVHRIVYSYVVTRGRYSSHGLLSRSLSFRNLVLGYECERVVPAGVGLDPLSRDVTNRLSSRFSRSVETQRHFGWLRMVFTRCASPELYFRSPRELVVQERRGVLPSS